MELKKQKQYYIIFIGLYFLLNIINTYFITAQVLNRYISPVTRTFIGELTAFIGNFAVLLLFLIIGYVIFKKDRSKLKYLLVVTGILNFFIFALGFYNLFYGTSFSTNALDIFRNPAGDIATGLGTELIKELFLYYRILIFVPLIVLVVIYFKFRQYEKQTTNLQLIKKTKVRILNSFITTIFLLFISTLSFVTQVKHDNFVIGSVISTKGVQNYGVYPFYLTSLFGADFDITSRVEHDIENIDKLKNSYDNINKNQLEYTNLIDGLTYSNVTTLNNSKVFQNELLNLNNEDPLNGIFEDKNLVLVHLESLNYFLWEIPEVRQRFTFLNKLFEESFVFENYYTTVGLGVSSDAEATILTGLEMNGFETFYRSYDKRKYEIDTLPKLFANNGYKSQAVHSDTEKFYNRDVAYPNLIGFTEDYYSSEDIAIRANYANLDEFREDRKKNPQIYDHYKYENGIKILSPWISEYELADISYELAKAMNDKHMIMSLYMTPHTPFMFNPFLNEQYENLPKLKSITSRYLEFAKYIDETIEAYFVDPKTGLQRDLSNNVYVFYSDHGSSIKNGDLSKLFKTDLSLLEERRMLQQTIAFIYAPSNIKTDTTGINEGILKGRQTLTRSHVDMYRTIVDLFNIKDDTTFYFGVNGLSNEPTFALDNRIQDLVFDDLDTMNDDNYKPNIVSLRNIKNRYPKKNYVNEQQMVVDIRRYKVLTDLLLADANIYKEYQGTLQK